MIYISTIKQLQTVLDESPKAKFMLGGELVFVTTEKDAIDELLVNHEDNYVVQPKRKAGKSRSGSSLYVAVAKDAAELLEGRSGYDVIAADQYLAYGLSLKDDTIVIGGALNHDTNEVVFEVFVFTGSQLIEYYEKEVRNSTVTIQTALTPIFRDHPDHFIHWCAGLPDAPMDRFDADERFIDHVDFSKGHGIKRKLHTKSQGVDEPWFAWQGAAVAAAGAAVFACVIGFSWAGLQSERQYYLDEVAGFEDSYRNSDQSLQLLRHRDFLLKQTNSGVQVLDTVDALLARLSGLDGVIIHRVTVLGDMVTSQAPRQTAFGMVNLSKGDFLVEISLPAFDASARVQGEQVIRGLSERSGMSFRLVSHRKEVITSNDIAKDYWRYQMVGGKPNAI